MPMTQKSTCFILHASYCRILSTGMLAALLFIFSCTPKEKVELRRIKDIVVDVNTDPLLRANAVLYNPNNISMTLRKIDMEVFVDGKKAALIEEYLKQR